MKKIVALVLSLVMVLSLSATAFAADVVLWKWNNSNAECDVYTGELNTKMNGQNDPVTVVRTPATSLKFNADGSVKTTGVIEHYNVLIASGTDMFGVDFVRVDSIPKDADAADYITVKPHDDSVAQGFISSQTKNVPHLFLKAVDAVTYDAKAVEFTAWSDKCEHFAEPGDADDVDYFTVANKTDDINDLEVKYAAAAVNSDADSAVNVLVGKEVVTLNIRSTVSETLHVWDPTKYDADDETLAIEFVCKNCGTAGKYANSPYNVPAGHKSDNTPFGIIYYVSTGASSNAPAGTQGSPATFDAGIAMYVGMSLMAVAGSAAVIGKKKEF